MTKRIVPGSVEWVIAYREGKFKHVPAQNHLFKEQPAPQIAKPSPGRTPLWTSQITRLIERGGSKCHYCRRPLKIRQELADPRPDDATIDHKIPRSKGGSNAMENLLLACRKCNHEKEDRSYEDFMARPHRVKRSQRPLHPSSPWPKGRGVQRDPSVRAVLDRFPGAKIVDVRTKKAPDMLPAGETARWLRDQGKLVEIGEGWPWLQDLIRDRVRQVGFGPWK